MVFLSLIRYASTRIGRCPNPNSFWKRRAVYRQTQYFSRRRRNCYKIAIIALNKALSKATKARHLKKLEMRALWETRIEAACNEHGTNKWVLLEGLARSNVFLDRKILTELAIREPRTFKCLTDVAATKFNSSPPQSARLVLDPPPPGVITRGML